MPKNDNCPQSNPTLLTNILATPITKNGIPYKIPLKNPFFINPAPDWIPIFFISKQHNTIIRISAQTLSIPIIGLLSH